jgi:type II secretory pathway component GspD/PulD (secretin)
MFVRASGVRVTVISLVVALLVLPSLGTSSVLASPLRVTQVTVKDVDNRLVVGIIATGQILFNVTEISTPRPPRVAIDILNAVVDERIRGTNEVNKGNILRVRVGQFQDSPAIARIVVDLAHPVPVQAHLASPTVLTVSVPLQQAAEAQSEAVPSTAVPARLGVAAPAAGVAPGTGVIRTAQPLPPPPLPGGSSSGPGILRLVEFRGVALADVLTAFAKLCGFNLVTDGSIAGTITLRLLDVTCEEALRFVLETNNLGYRRLGKNLIVGSADKLAPPPEVPETIAYRLAYGDPNAIRAAVAAAVPGVRVAVDARTNALLITGTSAQHEEVVKVLGTLDVRIPQVVIQVHVVEVGTSYVKTLGLFGGQGSGALGPGTFGTVAVDSANNRLTFTLSSTTLFFFQLQALINEGKARVVTAPRVATLDGNKATIVLGQRVPIFTSVTVGGQLQTTVNYQDVGVQLETTPRVNSDQVITLGLKPTVSSLGAAVSSGGQTAYIINNRTAETQLSVQDGKTIVLGGLISRDERLTTIKVPVLGDVPILGEMFKNTNTTITETELIFLITPQIVKD